MLNHFRNHLAAGKTTQVLLVVSQGTPIGLVVPSLVGNGSHRICVIQAYQQSGRRHSGPQSRDDHIFICVNALNQQKDHEHIRAAF